MLRPEDDPVEWRVHDRTHVEFAIDYPAANGPATYRWEAYFFVPSSFRLDETTYEKKELYDDLQSYVRLAVPELPFARLCELEPPGPLGRLKVALGAAKGAAEGSVAAGEAGRELRLFACYLRASGLAALREVERAVDAATTDGAELRALAVAFGQSCAAAAGAFRTVIDGALAGGLPAELATIVRWTDEDASLVLESLCANLAVSLERRAEADAGLRGLAEHVAALAVGEARHRAARGYDSVVDGDGDERHFEHLEFRRHVLKRFTSSTLWLSLERREGQQWVLHALYAAAAAIAMTFALVASIQTNPFSQQVFRYAILVAVAYAAKDRIKAVLQNNVNKWIARRFPDRLWSIRDRERGRDLGLITERAGFLPFGRAPAEVLGVRRLTREHALEELARPEVVLWHKKAVALNPEGGKPGQFPAITEIFRLNLRQWLEHTDDPNRKFLFADPRDARIYSATARRVYNINVVYRLTRGAEDAPWHRIRVVVSRKGIERIDDIRLRRGAPSCEAAGPPRSPARGPAMIRAPLAAPLAACLLLALPSTARADGLALPYGDACWGGAPDADADGLDDDCEQGLAVAFMPRLWFDSGESGYGRRPYFAVKSQGFAARAVQIIYLDVFFDDTGVTTGHDGDAEFQIFEVHYSAGRWLLDWAYLSAHRKSVCDSSAWYDFDQLEYDTAAEPQNAFRGRPTLYVAEDKHATYPDLGTCDAGCFLQDYCSRHTVQHLDTAASPLASRNVGSTQVKLINKVTLNGQSEFLLDDVEFKGWDNQWYRANSEGYRRHLDDFGF